MKLSASPADISKEIARVRAARGRVRVGFWRKPTKHDRRLEKHSLATKKGADDRDATQGGADMVLTIDGEEEEVYAVDDLDALVDDIVNFDEFSHEDLAGCMRLAVEEMTKKGGIFSGLQLSNARARRNQARKELTVEKLGRISCRPRRPTRIPTTNFCNVTRSNLLHILTAHYPRDRSRIAGTACLTSGTPCSLQSQS